MQLAKELFEYRCLTIIIPFQNLPQIPKDQGNISWENKADVTEFGKFKKSVQIPEGITYGQREL